MLRLTYLFRRLLLFLERITLDTRCISMRSTQHLAVLCAMCVKAQSTEALGWGKVMLRIISSIVCSVRRFSVLFDVRIDRTARYRCTSGCDWDVCGSCETQFLGSPRTHRSAFEARHKIQMGTHHSCRHCPGPCMYAAVEQGTVRNISQQLQNDTLEWARQLHQKVRIRDVIRATLKHPDAAMCNAELAC